MGTRNRSRIHFALEISHGGLDIQIPGRLTIGVTLLESTQSGNSSTPVKDLIDIKILVLLLDGARNPLIGRVRIRVADIHRTPIRPDQLRRIDETRGVPDIAA